MIITGRTFTRNGKLLLRMEQESHLLSWCSLFPEGTRFKITIELDEEPWSKRMYNYYYGVLIPIFIECMRERGSLLDKEKADLALKELFDMDVTYLDEERVTIEPGQKRTMQAHYGHEYITNCIAYIAKEFGVSVPPPITYDL